MFWKAEDLSFDFTQQGEMGFAKAGAVTFQKTWKNK